jgi:predicted ATPase
VPGIDPRLVEVEILWDRVQDRSSYPFCIPAINSLKGISLDQPVTFLVGENGSGKSTLLEAIAVGAGLNAEGGSQNLRFTTRESHSPLHEHLQLSWRGRPKRAFFLRAESFYNVASSYEEVLDLPSLHDRSHGESFLEAIERHFGPRGLYLLDEPESALSIRGQLALLRHLHDRLTTASQFIISTHSPILLAFPEAKILRMTDDGPTSIEYRDTDQFQLTRSFLDDPDRFFRHLFDDDE